MGLILCIETSTKACSTALCRDGSIIASEFLFTGEYLHAESLNPMISDLLSGSSIAFNQLDAIAISQGPGSYTGLRIGTSTAKGLCFALDIPLIAIDTLQLIAIAAKQEQPASRYIALMDARRMEVYTKKFDANLQAITKAEALILDENSFSDFEKESLTVFCGDGALKAKSLFEKSNFIFLPEIHPKAEYMGELAEEKFSIGQFEDTAYFEPFYLKEFHTPQPKS